MTTRLIVGFDGSDHARAALEWAVREADARGAAVRVITAFSTPPVLSYYGMSSGTYRPDEYELTAHQYRRQALEAVDKALAAHPAVGIDVDVVDAFPADALLHAASSTDLIVVGSSGAGSIKSFLLGSVAADVLHHSSCPVVVVPAHVSPPTGRIAVGVDGSDSSNQALAWSADEAQRTNSDLIVVHAWEYPYRLTEEGFARGCDVAQVDAGIVLDQAIERARNLTTVPVERQLLEGGVVQALLDLSAEVDMIVLGTRGRGGFRSMVLGSVTMAVAANAQAPVVVIPAP